jgi:hypothetical protein
MCDNAWRAEELRKALKEARKGVFTSHEAMLAWVDALGTDKELSSPEPDIDPRRKPERTDGRLAALDPPR